MVADADAPLLTSPLNARHAELGAKFAQFGGWSMPLEYTGAVTEHRAVRAGVGMFDVSHLGKAVVKGPGAAAFVNTCLTNDLAKLRPGQAQYTLCCTSEGGVGRITWCRCACGSPASPASRRASSAREAPTASETSAR